MAIGLGSFAFHTLATRWALYLDVIPIAVFQLVFLWLYVRHVMRTTLGIAVLAVAGFLGLSFLTREVFAGLHISLYYTPTLLVLLAFGVYHAATAARGRFDLLAAAGVLAVSLGFRTIDSTVCGIFPLGTHFLWHLLNGVVLYLALRVMIRHREGSKQTNAVPRQVT